MQELVVISGKGGTGKTSLVAAFATLADKVVLADCDVDAPDLHLILQPAIVDREAFIGGKTARIDPELCIHCGSCRAVCRLDAVTDRGPANEFTTKTSRIDPIACEGCGVCVWFCPEGAIELVPAENGNIFESKTRFGWMAHAQLGVAQGNSGKLVTEVRKKATHRAAVERAPLVITDGSPGVGCPVIASITGADAALIVVEPTMSAVLDMKRVAALLDHFHVPGLVCINKWDLSPAITEEIVAYASEQGLADAGRVRFDAAVTAAQLQRQSIVEYTREGSGLDVRDVWDRVCESLETMRHASPARRTAHE